MLKMKKFVRNIQGRRNGGALHVTSLPAL